MSKSWVPVFLLLTLSLTACSKPTTVEESGSSTGAPAAGLEVGPRIARVEDGLVPVDAAGPSSLEAVQSLAARMAHYEVPGVSIAVVDGYKLAWARGYGVLQAGGTQAVTPGTLFHAGSVAKTLSAAAALALVQEGQLALDQDINDIMTSWQVPDNEHTLAEKVTLRRLLSHSAGLEDGFTNRSTGDRYPAYLARGGASPTVALQELLDAAPGVDVDGPARITLTPGTEYRYANADYAILEILLVDVTNTPFEQFMAEKVLAPLEMASSTYEQPLPVDLRARASSEHGLNGDPIEGERLHFPFRAAGGLWTTPTDLARFAIEVMLAYQGESDQVLSQAMVEEMLSPQVAAPPNPLFDAVGLGFHLSGEGDGLSFWHTGGTWGSSCVLWAYPETGQGAVVMTNKADDGSGSILFEILFSIAREYGWPVKGS